MTSDQILRGLLPAPDLRVIVVHATETARKAAELHGCSPTAAAVLARALVGGALLGGLGKGDERVTLQLEGDGPMRGLFIDASAEGAIRAWIRGPSVHFPGRDPTDLDAPLGPNKYLSVLRELPSGEFYRGAIELTPPRLDEALARYFEVSEQVPTRLGAVVEVGDDGRVARAEGILVQRLPGGDEETLAELGARLSGPGLAAAFASDGAVPALPGLEPLEVLERAPLAYRCPCTRERATRGVLAAGKAEIEAMIAAGGTALTCEFCKTVYRFSADDLRTLAAAGEPEPSP
jgi:molecular chaperone Hsp33